MTIDLAVIIIYLVAINIIGMKSSKVSTMEDYFLGRRSIPWLIACFSIVATETSTLTFISIPGLAYTTNMGFLQIALGYIIGRILVAFVLLPGYFAGNLETTYQFLQNRFGPMSRRLVAVIFHVTRILGDGVRLFATAIPLAMLMGMGDNYVPAIVVISIATFIYTLYGGIRSVAITDSIQFFLYLFCAVLGVFLICSIMGRSPVSLFAMIPADNIKIFSSGLTSGMRGFFGSYNIFSGLIGGALLSFASHGTDHLIVQRVLACGGLKAARKAMITSGVIVFFQFFLFLLLGLFIRVLLGGAAFQKPDEIMPYFIINYLPPGIKGLMLAGILAAAMSTLSSSINSLSSSTTMDILNISEKNISEKKKVMLSRVISLVWMLVIMVFASLLKNTRSPLVELGLAIASITYGGMLSIFIQARMFKNFSDRAAIAGVFISIAALCVIAAAGDLFWPWYVPLGFVISFVSGIIINYVFSRNSKGKIQECK